MDWLDISTAPMAGNPDDLPDAMRMMAGVIAPIIALRDASGATGLGMWNCVTRRWQITKGDLGEPVQWREATSADLAAPAEVWPFPGIPEPDGWRG